MSHCALTIPLNSPGTAFLPPIIRGSSLLDSFFGSDLSMESIDLLSVWVKKTAKIIINYENEKYYYNIIKLNPITHYLLKV